MFIEIDYLGEKKLLNADYIKSIYIENPSIYKVIIILNDNNMDVKKYNFPTEKEANTFYTNIKKQLIK